LGIIFGGGCTFFFGISDGVDVFGEKDCLGKDGFGTGNAPFPGGTGNASFPGGNGLEGNGLSGIAVGLLG